MPELPVFDSNLTPQSSSFVGMLSWVRSFVADTDPLELLRVQRAIYEKARLYAEVGFFDLILGGVAGEIRAASCLDVLLLADHLENFPIRKKLTEFQAVILRKADASGSWVRIYSVSADLDGMAPSLQPWIPRIQEDLTRGWRASEHLHNHPFQMQSESDEDVVGTVIPSESDANAYLWWSEMVGLEQARITNGFSTLVIPGNQFRLFVRPRPISF